MLGYMMRQLMLSCKVSSGGTTARSLASSDSNDILADTGTENGKNKLGKDEK